MNDKATKLTTLLKLFYSLFKSDGTDKKQIHSISTSQEAEENNIGSCKEDETDLETAMERPIEKEKSKIDLLTSWDRPEIGKKNKWLYPIDNFGKMEHGVVD